MANQLNHGLLMKALDYGYEKAVNGLPRTETAEELAYCYLKVNCTLRKNADSLVRCQVIKAGASGFLTGIGGFITLPVAIPANITAVLYLQLRMVAAIATMEKHDIRNDRVKTLAYMCLCGSAVTNLAKDIGIQVGTKITVAAIKKISGATITKVNQAVGFRLLTKFGQAGVINMGKAVPLFGGIISGGNDGISTKVVGKAAIEAFL